MIYVLAPYGVAGGIEGLYQLADKLGEQAFLVRIGIEQDSYRYDHYKVQHCNPKEIIDAPENIIVIPEVFDGMIQAKHAKVVIWWFSSHWGGNNHDFSLDNGDRRLAHSEHVIGLIKKRGAEKIHKLTDYVNVDVFNDRGYKRQNIVLHNIWKEAVHVNKLKEVAPDIAWIPVFGRTDDDIAGLMNHAKVYLEVCTHGRGRMTREAAACGCNIVMWNKGSAEVYNDTPFNEIYKVDITKPDKAIKKINDAMLNYDDHKPRFDYYRTGIAAEERIMEKQIEEFFN